MPVSKFTLDERIKMAEEARATSIKDVCDKYSVQPAIVYGWLRRYKNGKHHAIAKHPRVFAKREEKKNKLFDEVSFLKSEIEKRDKIILQFALKYFTQKLYETTPNRT